MEIVVVLVVALVVIGPGKLPGMARSMGSGVRELRDALSGDADDRDESPPRAAAVGPARGDAV